MVYCFVLETPLQMPATWPLGTYTLPKPKTGCLSGFVDGTVTMAQAVHNVDPTNLHLDGTRLVLFITHYIFFENLTM